MPLTSPKTASSERDNMGSAWRNGLLLVASALLSLNAHAELLGYVGAQLRWFPETAADPRQGDEAVSLVIAPEWFTQFNDNNDSINIKAFYRYDSMDDERTHGDLRELYWLHVGDDWEFTLGVNKVFWGVTESQSLVDIINQTDVVEAPDGDEKLGQAMAHLALINDWGVVDLFVLPGFRPQTLPGVEGRLRSLPVTLAKADTYESADGKDHIDYAARWSHYIGDLTLGVSWFDGTSREPEFVVAQANGQTVLQPHYVQMQQAGVDSQYIWGDWLWKLELIHRNYDNLGIDDFWAATGGFEFTYVGIFGTIYDLGLLAEYSYDDRDQAGGVLQNDLLVGGRFSFNDIASSEILFGFIQDMDDSESHSTFLEASTRIGDRTKVAIEAAIIHSSNISDPQFSVAQDSYLELTADWYF